MEGAEGWQISNPPVLAFAPLLASLEIFGRAGLPRLREKSISLSAFLRRLIQERLPGGIEIITPEAPELSGCQVSLRLDPAAFDVRHCHERLVEAGVIGDWREPDTLRLAPVPDWTPPQFTVLGWDVKDIVAVVKELRNAGGEFQRYPWMKDQDEVGIWTSPSGPGVAAVHAGARVAWFKDPDGNVLSVAQMPA